MSERPRPAEIRRRPRYDEAIGHRRAIEESAAESRGDLEDLREKVRRLKTGRPDGNLGQVNPEALSERVVESWLWYQNLILDISGRSDSDLTRSYSNILADMRDQIERMNQLTQKENEADFYFVQWVLNKLTPLIGWGGENLSPNTIKKIRMAINRQRKRILGL